jgi:hypothetical protein
MDVFHRLSISNINNLRGTRFAAGTEPREPASRPLKKPSAGGIQGVFALGAMRQNSELNRGGFLAMLNLF